MENILISGANGFIARHLIKKLQLTDHVLHGIIKNPTHDLSAYSIHLHLIDITKSFVEQLPLHEPIVIHTAALMSTDNHAALIDTNVVGTKNVLDWAIRNHAKQIIFISSGGVYGYQSNYFFTELDRLQPIGSYGLSKQIGENLVHLYQQTYGLHAAIVRPFFPYGLDQKRGVIPFICNAVTQQGRLKINKEGRPNFNPVYIDDLVLALLNIIKINPKFQIFNLSGDETISFLELVNFFETKTQKMAILEETHEEIGDLLGSNLFTKEHLDWKPQAKLYDMLNNIGEH